MLPQKKKNTTGPFPIEAYPNATLKLRVGLDRQVEESLGFHQVLSFSLELLDIDVVLLHQLRTLAPSIF